MICTVVSTYSFVKCKHSSELLSIAAEKIKMDKAVASVAKTMPLLFLSG